MKKFSRFLALTLCLVMCLSLAACGGSGGSDADTAEEAAESAGEAAAPAEEEAPAGGEDSDYKVFNYGTDANSTTFDPASDLQTNSGNFLVHAVGETL